MSHYWDDEYYSYTKRARVIQILGRDGKKGQVTKVWVEFRDEKYNMRRLVRNIKGPVQVGDIITLMEWERSMTKTIKKRKK